MSIVLNECAWAENAISSATLGSKPYETLTRVAKYYTYNGMKKASVRNELEKFMLSCDPTISLIAWSDTLDSAVRYASKYPPVMIDGVFITKAEMNRIEALAGKQLQRLAFTLLCIAKYFYAIAPSTDYWVSSPDNEIMSMANINTSIRRQSSLFSQLRDAGMIRFSRKVDNLSVRVLFVENDEHVMKVTDFRNLGYQYMKYHGGKYFVCSVCGITEKARDPSYSSRRKYCDACASKIHIQQTAEAAARRRVNQ